MIVVGSRTISLLDPTTKPTKTKLETERSNGTKKPDSLTRTVMSVSVESQGEGNSRVRLDDESVSANSGRKKSNAPGLRNDGVLRYFSLALIIMLML